VDAFFTVQERIVRIRETYQDRLESPFILLAGRTRTA
jgi:hypothetical protein